MYTGVRRSLFWFLRILTTSTSGCPDVHQQDALSWLMAKSTNNLPLPGGRTVEQVQENAGALAHGPLAVSAMSEIEVLIRRAPVVGRAHDR